MTDNENPNTLVVRLTKECHQKGFFVGALGSVAIKQGGNIFIGPSASQVRADDLQEENIFEVSADDGFVVQEPPPEKGFIINESLATHLEIFKADPSIGAVIECRSAEAIQVSYMLKGKTVMVRDPEIVLGPTGHTSAIPIPLVDGCSIPKLLGEKISAEINKAKAKNTVKEDKETKIETEEDSKITNTNLELYCPAVIVKGKGYFVWGRNWIECFNRSEHLNLMISTAIGFQKAGMNIYTHVMTAPKTGEDKKGSKVVNSSVKLEPNPSIEEAQAVAPKRPRIEPPPKDVDDVKAEKTEKTDVDTVDQSLDVLAAKVPKKNRRFKRNKAPSTHQPAPLKQVQTTGNLAQRIGTPNSSSALTRGSNAPNRGSSAPNRVSNISNKGSSAPNRGSSGFNRGNTSTNRGITRGGRNPHQRFTPRLTQVPSPWAAPPAPYPDQWFGNY